MKTELKSSDTNVNEPDSEQSGVRDKPRPNGDQMVAAVNRSYAWVDSISRVVRTDLKEISYRKANDFRTSLGNRYVGTDDGRKALGGYWLTHPNRRSFDSIAYCPPPRKPPQGSLNLWQGFGIVPAPGDWSRMREHIRMVIAAGDPVLDEYVIRWLAWTVQNPGSQAEVALVLQGGQGTGKGTLGNTLREIFGQHAVHVTSPKQFAQGQFNAHLVRCSFLFADECYWGGDKRHEGQLKGMLTEPKLMIEPKGVDAYPIDNALHVLISSNNEWVVPVALDDRRFVVCKVSETHKQAAQYFEGLAVERANGGTAAMLHDLLTFDLGDWHPRQLVSTDAKRDQQERSLGSEEKWLLAMLAAGTLPAHPGTKPDEGTAYSSDLETSLKRSDRYADVAQMRKGLRSIGARPFRKSDARGWSFPSLQECRERWEESHWPRSWEPVTDDAVLEGGRSDWIHESW